MKDTEPCPKRKSCKGWSVAECSSRWCPYQALLCRHKTDPVPYFEALKALPLPEPLYKPISRSDRYMHIASDHFPDPDRAEDAMNAALDSARWMDARSLLVRSALYRLSPRLRKTIGMLIGMQASDEQFDFGAVAHRITAADRGIPMGAPPSSWREAKSYAKARAQDAWVEALERLLSVLR